jgi:hypothetical protein
MVKEQSDFFDANQLGLNLGDSAEALSINAHAVRLQLNALIEEAKAAQDTAPWDEKTQHEYQLSFPQLAKRLPSEEATFLTRQFEFEIARIEKLRVA